MSSTRHHLDPLPLAESFGREVLEHHLELTATCQPEDVEYPGAVAEHKTWRYSDLVELTLCPELSVAEREEVVDSLMPGFVDAYTDPNLKPDKRLKLEWIFRYHDALLGRSVGAELDVEGLSSGVMELAEIVRGAEVHTSMTNPRHIEDDPGHMCFSTEEVRASFTAKTAAQLLMQDISEGELQYPASAREGWPAPNQNSCSHDFYTIDPDGNKRAVKVTMAREPHGSSHDGVLARISWRRVVDELARGSSTGYDFVHTAELVFDDAADTDAAVAYATLGAIIDVEADRPVPLGTVEILDELRSIFHRRADAVHRRQLS